MELYTELKLVQKKRATNGNSNSQTMNHTSVVNNGDDVDDHGIITL